MEPTVRVLGTPVVTVDGRSLEPPPGKMTALLLYLACAEGWVSRDDLVYLLWPDTEEDRARNNLRQLLHRAKSVDWAGALERDRARVRWRVASDLGRFREALAEEATAEAVVAYGGPLLDGFRLGDAPEFESWLEIERQEIHSAWRDATMARAEELRTAQRTEEAAELLAAVAGADPLDESAHRAWIEALWGAGARTEALTTYDAFRDRLRAELGVEPEAETRAVADAIRDGRSPPAPGRQAKGGAAAATPRPQALPVPATRFVGRRDELREMRSAIRERGVRLLSLVAPGGMGKTRAALALASDLRDAFADGVAFASFAATARPEQMEVVLAEALGVTLTPGTDPRDQLLGILARRRELLVMDNLEHLVDDLSLISDLLEHCPGVAVIATSRERLGLAAEYVHDVRGLEYAVDSEGSGARSDAAELFVQEARRVRGSVVEDELARDMVDRIAALVRGMPLALALAASWLRVLPLEDIAVELERGYELLESRDAGIAERHRSIQAVFDATWSRLGLAERDAWARLSLFEGGFTREAAHDVARVGLPLLLALANKAILARSAKGRFELHPLVLHYGRDRAGELDLVEDVRTRHAAHYLDGIVRAEAAFYGPDVTEAVGRVTTELPNLRAAWRWAADAGDAPRIADAALALWAYFEILGNEEAFVPMCAHAVDALGGEERVEAMAPAVQRAIGRMLPFAGDPSGDHVERVARSLAMLERIGDARGRARMLVEFSRSRTSWLDGGYREAAVEAFQAMGDEHGVARALKSYAFPRVLAGEYAEAHDMLEGAIARVRRAGDRRMEALALDDIVVIDVLRGDMDRAVRRAERVGEILADLAMPAARAEHAGTLRWLNVVRGDYEEAERHQEDYISFYDAVGDGIPAISGMLRCELAMKRGHYETARAEGEAALEVFRRYESRGFTYVVTRLALGRAELRGGRPDAALEHARESFLAARALDAPRFVLNAAGLLGEYLLAVGDAECAFDLLAAVRADPVTEHEVRAMIDEVVASDPSVLEGRPSRDRAWVERFVEEAIGGA